MMRRSFAALAALLLLGFPALAQDFPQRFEHAFGETVVPEQPQRVVSLGYVGHDDLLAIGVVPVALRYWFGDVPNGVWPWAETALGEARPEVLQGEVSMERVAALAPDLILAVSSGITAEEYAVLSQIAPTVASEARYGGFSTPWDVQALTLGRATGHLAEAEAQVAAIRDRLARLRAEHPEWQGRSAVAAYLWSGTPGVFLPGDSRVNLLAELGFVTPPAVAALGDGFFAELSPEDLGLLDADLLVWVSSDGDTAPLRDLPLRPTLRAHGEGREVLADALLGSAMSHASLLSLPYALDRLVPEIEAAIDGDPATGVPSAQEAQLAP